MALKSGKGWVINEDHSVTYPDGPPTAEIRERAEKALVGLQRERASEGYDIPVEQIDVALSDGTVDRGEANQRSEES